MGRKGGEVPYQPRKQKEHQHGKNNNSAKITTTRARLVGTNVVWLSNSIQL
jgi:hypothetical protein